MIAALVNQTVPAAGFLILLAVMLAAAGLSSLPLVRGAAAGVRAPSLRQLARAPSTAQRPFASLLLRGRNRIFALLGLAGIVGLASLGGLGLVAYDSRIRAEHRADSTVRTLEGRIAELEAELAERDRAAQQALAERDKAAREALAERDAQHAAAVARIEARQREETAALQEEFARTQAEQGKDFQTKEQLQVLQNQLSEQSIQTLTDKLDAARETIRRQEATIADLRAQLKAATE